MFRDWFKYGAVLVLLLFAIGPTIDFLRYGWGSLSPRYSLREIDNEKLKALIEPGVTRRKDLFRLFGKPDSESGKVEFPEGTIGNPEADRLARYRTITWRQWVGFYLVISISLDTRVLTVFLDDDGTVADFSLTTER